MIFLFREASWVTCQMSKRKGLERVHVVFSLWPSQLIRIGSLINHDIKMANTCGTLSEDDLIASFA